MIWPPSEKVVRHLVFYGDDSLHNFVAQQRHRYFSRLRSILTFDCIEPPSKALLSDLLSSKFLKGVSFGGMQLEEIPKEIFNLFHLRTLCLCRSQFKTVPKAIKKLRNLGYLDLCGTPVRELPVEILNLRKLCHLKVCQGGGDLYHMQRYGFKAPPNMESLLALESLFCIDAAENDEMRIITEIGKLTKLRIFTITNLRREDGKELCSSLEKLVNLKELFVGSSFRKDERLDLNHQISASSLQSICYLGLRGRLEKMPQWISNLQNLGKINLIRSCLRDAPLESLQHLPNLIFVNLHQAYEGESLCFKAGGFQKLRHLMLKKMNGLRRMTVEEGAMPRIKRLYLENLPVLEDVPSGVEQLRELQNVWLWCMSFELTNKLEGGSEDYHKKTIGLYQEVPSGIEHLCDCEMWLRRPMSELTNKLEGGSEDYNKKRIGHIQNVYINGRWIHRE